MIELSNVSKSFQKRTAVYNLSLKVNRGDIFGLVGPDGAGKTTVIRMITGVLAPTAGKIFVLGQENLGQSKPYIGYVPQRFSLYGDLSVMENIKLMGALYGASSKQTVVLAEELLRMTKLAPFANRLAANLSGGMKQKLALAAGLMHRPQLLFLDEPTTGVDPVSRREFWQVLYRLNQEGTTIFVSTPYMDEAELCTRIAFMNEGQITAADTPQGLKAQYPYRIIELRAASKEVKKYLTGIDIYDINSFGDKYHIAVEDYAVAATAIRQRLEHAGVAIESLKEIKPMLEDVFVTLASKGDSL
ncbi:hypothetical protein P22_2825 [Propionispora sp. 2/2-37]|uniref:ABC transporter ATP-binding protein n=1 Tax=Propionispora sp. 2/2-37 TaxID=1677858 RepID=UPI0006BB8467|nr:ABC transporter ATP-binding protein [Propionispora sp. 2/2-37]CUH96735.1 hypothetical protein P22_2825 [Propionispora sp. 2/2-37]